MDLTIRKIAELDAKIKNRVDAFILDDLSNGEFINTLTYLSYHPKGRFTEDSIVVEDAKSGTIKSVVMAASLTHEPETIISHPGTTFSGPIFKPSQGVEEMDEILRILFDYYEQHYSNLEFRMQPTSYASQPLEDLPYLFMKKKYEAGYRALANVIQLTDIKNEEDIFKMYQSRKRSQVRKLIRAGTFNFQKEAHIDENIWTHINQNLDERHEASTTHSFQEITHLRNKFPEQIVPYTMYTKDGKYGAFALVFKFKQVFHTQYLDTNYQFKTESPNVLLNHKLIQTAVQEGFRLFSFGSSTENGGEVLNQGLYNFKKQFGGGRILLPRFNKRMED